MNISSIKCHFDKLLVLLSTSMVNFDIVILYETWLLNDVNCIVNVHQSFNSLAVNNKSDGVTIFIKNRYLVKNVCTNLMSNVNSIEFKFDINGIEFVVMGCYRSPSDNIDAFLYSLNNYLTQSSDIKYHIICGDFNINILKSSYLKVINYLNIFAGFDFYSCINNVTRQSNTADSCLGHFFIKIILPGNIKSYVFLSSITDHFSIILSIKLKC
ncbi:unnamed protein product [Macrosiphum euphorbiae]|uniref:Uncharacterized protein n=1 Tax=Macrosiphum euphorbiae TaxID=13131 RepID=A0AAV0XCQ1_9HEMI|nr:unnamed protein product [Macrosiphum euphorbiae]